MYAAGLVPRVVFFRDLVWVLPYAYAYAYAYVPAACLAYSRTEEGTRISVMFLRPAESGLFPQLASRGHPATAFSLSI